MEQEQVILNSSDVYGSLIASVDTLDGSVMNNLSNMMDELIQAQSELSREKGDRFIFE